MNPLIIGAVLLFGKQLIGAGVAAKKLQFNPIGVKVISGKLNVVMQITNPAQTSIKVDAVFLTCFLTIGTNKSKIGMVTIPSGSGFTISKLGITTVNMPITLSGLGLAQIALQVATNLSAITAGTMKAVVEVAGTVVSMGLTQTIDETVPLDVASVTGG